MSLTTPLHCSTLRLCAASLQGQRGCACLRLWVPGAVHALVLGAWGCALTAMHPGPEHCVLSLMLPRASLLIDGSKQVLKLTPGCNPGGQSQPSVRCLLHFKRSLKSEKHLSINGAFLAKPPNPGSLLSYRKHNRGTIFVIPSQLSCSMKIRQILQKIDSLSLSALGPALGWTQG